VSENPYPVLVPPRLEKTLPWLKRFVAKHVTPIRVFVDTAHFKAPTEIYLGYCPVHKTFFLDYMHGYQGYLLCPLCLEEEAGEPYFSLDQEKCPVCGGYLAYFPGLNICLKCGYRHRLEP